MTSFPIEVTQIDCREIPAIATRVWDGPILADGEERGRVRLHVVLDTHALYVELLEPLSACYMAPLGMLASEILINALKKAAQQSD